MSDEKPTPVDDLKQGLNLLFRAARGAVEKLPADKIIIPGVIDSTSNFVEHPELVAERLERYATVVGRERVMAGVDCGFGTFAGRLQVDSKIVWMKLASLAEGARLASKQLW